MELVDGEVYCHVHGCVHEASNDPYRYEFGLSGETPECDREDWSKLWIGAALPQRSRGNE